MKYKVVKPAPVRTMVGKGDVDRKLYRQPLPIGTVFEGEAVERGSSVTVTGFTIDGKYHEHLMVFVRQGAAVYAVPVTESGATLEERVAELERRVAALESK